MYHPIENSSEFSHDIALTCLDPWGREVAVSTTLGYRTNDPYALSLLFHSAAGDVEWVVSRTALLQGLATACGEGDFKVHPHTEPDGRAVIILDFSSPDGHLVAHADSREMQSFLARTFAAVPVGAESDFIDLDALVADLLGTASN
jgi:hypothetical protein